MVEDHEGVPIALNWWKSFNAQIQKGSFERFSEHPTVQHSSVYFLFNQIAASPKDQSRWLEALAPYYTQTRFFRLAHPTVRFYRCWNCDLTSTDDYRPLMPPERFAHSTMNNYYLRGRPGWEDWSLYEAVERRYHKVREELEAKRHNPPRLLSGRTEYGMKMAEYNYQRETEAHRVDIDTLVGQLREIERDLSRFTKRPLATAHHPCPKCGTLFPFLLRPSSDTRYITRSIENVFSPLTAIEYYLWGDDCTASQWNPKPIESQYLAATEYALKCKLPITPLSLLYTELLSQFKWKLFNGDTARICAAFAFWMPIRD